MPTNGENPNGAPGTEMVDRDRATADMSSFRVLSVTFVVGLRHYSTSWPHVNPESLINES